MRAGNSCKKSLSLREFSVRVLCVFLMIGCLVSSAAAADFWDITVVDSGGDVGSNTSLAILPSGYPGISYFDTTNKNLKYASYDGTGWQTTTVDSAGWVGYTTSLAILPSGQPAISYSLGIGGYDLKYAWYDGSVWQTTTVDSAGNVGSYTSLAILPSGYPAISYYDWTNYDLKYAWYDGTAWQTTTVDSAGNVGSYTSLAILPSGHPAISYCDNTNKDLKYAWYNGSAWQTATLDNTLGYETSLAILPSGHPAISYSPGQDLKYAWYDGSTWQTTTVDTVGSVGTHSSLAVLPSGYPAINYYDYTNSDLKYAWYDGSAWQINVVDWVGDVGTHASLAILPSGQPAISYLDSSYYDLKFATPADSPQAPVAMTASYTATAQTDLGGATVVADGPAYNHGWGSGEIEAWAKSSVDLEMTDRGHLQAAITLAGTDGKDCVEWDPEVGCVEWAPSFSCEDANGMVTGTIVLGTSESYPGGSQLELALQVSMGGNPGDAENYHLKLWRGVTLLGQIDPGAPDEIVVPVFAGETLTFEFFASEEDHSADNWGYDCDFESGFEFRMILFGAANLNGIGTVDFRDFAIFGLAWKTEPGDAAWDPNCDISDPNDDIIDNNDLDVFTNHWLEGIAN